MPTTEELLEQLEAEAQSETPVCIIDPETRTVTVPPEYQLLGVENDKKVERLYFQCPKIVGDNQDLSQDYQLFINYENANGDPDAYHIDDMEIDGDNITFSWLLEENVTKYRGNIQFAFGAIKPGDEAEDPDKNRWNTTINADCTCLVGLKSTQQVAESNPDALVQIWAAIDELKAGGGGSGTPGKDGREIEIQNNGTAIQWRYVGDSDWTDLVQLSDLKGEGIPEGGTTGQVLTKNSNSDGDASWKNPSGVSDEQVKTAVRDYFEENPPSGVEIDNTLTQEGKAADAKITGEKLNEKIDKQKGVKFENIGFAKVYRYGRSYFNGNIPEGGTAVAPLGQIIQCQPGETLYCNFKLSPYQTSNQRVTVINYVPDKNFGQFPSKSICGYIEQQESGIYKISEDFTDAKAAFFPVGSTGNNQLGYYDRNSRYAVQNMSFDEIPKSYIQEEIVPYPQSEGLVVDTDKSMMLYASLFKAVSPMVGAKVYVSGDSITAQSSTLLNNTTSDDFGKGWYDRIGIKYMQQYECHGYGGNRWYSSGALKNSAVADVKKIIEAGVIYDYIVLEWGTNDIWSGASFGAVEDTASDADNAGTVAAIRWCIENLQSNFPSTRIIVIMPCMRNGNARQEHYYTLVDTILKSYGVRRVYMAYDSGITLSMMAPDGIHFRYTDAGDEIKQNMIGLEKYSKCLEAEMIKA